MTALRIGTRRSLLAIAQTRAIAARFEVAQSEVDIVEVTTEGDVDRTSPLQQLGGTGVFVSALREALLAGEVDVAVHSMKDIPTAPADGIRLAAVPERADPRDALVARDGATLEQLPEGARVGTGPPRRTAQLLHARPDLDVVGIRGNITTRMDRAIGPDADLDAVVLAAAGLIRAGFADRITDALATERFPQAPAQGALAIEVRQGDEATLAAVQGVEHAPSRAAVTAERLILAGLEAGCSAPVAANAAVRGDELIVAAYVYAPDGSRVLQTLATGPIAELADTAGRAVRELLDAGAAELVQ